MQKCEVKWDRLRQSLQQRKNWLRLLFTFGVPLLCLGYAYLMNLFTFPAYWFIAALAFIIGIFLFRNQGFRVILGSFAVSTAIYGIFAYLRTFYIPYTSDIFTLALAIILLLMIVDVFMVRGLALKIIFILLTINAFLNFALQLGPGTFVFIVLTGGVIGVFLIADLVRSYIRGYGYSKGYNRGRY